MTDQNPSGSADQPKWEGSLHFAPAIKKKKKKKKKNEGYDLSSINVFIPLM
jgi:hypothetical protein